MNLQHHFLIAMPSLNDPLFKRSVIYVCEHNDDGAMGIIINKPMENLTVKGVLKKLDIEVGLAAISKHLRQAVYTGGPVADDRGFILHSTPQTYSSSIRVSDSTVVTTSRDILEALTTDQHPDNVLVALGYCAWNKQQLEDEILENTWLTVPANETVLFNLPASERWQAAARALGIDIYNMTTEAGHS